MRIWCCQAFIAASLSAIALFRTDFSTEAIKAPIDDRQESLAEIPAREFRFLGKGRQSFVFVSGDGKFVLKFFNKRYFEIPWYGFFSQAEERKRNLRKNFYLHSYSIADKYLREETGILYLHNGRTKGLPEVVLVDRASRRFSVDLNQVPFVLQKRTEPLYASLDLAVMESFLDIIAKRISYGISDADHDVEHNFGYFNGQAIHIDPGRFSMGKEIDLDQEWWSATHRFKDFLEKERPELIQAFESGIRTRKRQMPQPSRGFPALQKDDSPLR